VRYQQRVAVPAIPRYRRAISAAACFVLAAALVLGRSALVLGNGTDTATESSIDLDRNESGLAKEVNAARAASLVPFLDVDPELASIARARSLDMATRHYFSHTTPDGQTIFDLLDAAQIPWVTAAENLAESKGVEPVQADVQGFLGSPAHRENLLSPRMRRMGIGFAVTGDGMTVCAVVFTN
jgi:uncharacterized protein YkwD